MRLFSPSRRPFVSLRRMAARIPSRCSRMVRASLTNGSSFDRDAQASQASRCSGAGVTVSVAGTLLGVYWVGLAFAHAELLRQLPHGGAVMIDVLLGTFLGDTGAYLGGRLFGRRPLAPP